MSKYNLEEIHNNNLKEALSAEEKDRFDQLSDSDQLKLEKIFAMMQAEKDAAAISRKGNNFKVQSRLEVKAHTDSSAGPAATRILDSHTLNDKLNPYQKNLSLYKQYFYATYRSVLAH